MREALTLALALVFGRLRLHRVEANIQPHNRPSIRLVKRLGFRREGYSPRYLNIGGRWRDHERWALLVEEWRQGAKEPPSTPQRRARSVRRRPHSHQAPSSA